MAIIRLFQDSGLRLAELTQLEAGDVDLDLGVVVVLVKGRRPRAVPFGTRTGQALERYDRVRRAHPLAKSPAWWLGSKGPTDSGVAQMLRRRCKDAGIAQLHPHQLRHTAAHQWLAAGGNEGDTMRLFGWKSRQMLNRSGALPTTAPAMRTADYHRETACS